MGLRTGGGERKCGSSDIPRLGKTLQWEAEVTGTETFQREDEREREKEGEINEQCFDH